MNRLDGGNMMLNQIPWYVALLQSAPETYLLTLLGFKLFNIDIDLKKNLLVSLITAIVAFGIRQIVTIYGIHTLLQYIIMVILVILIFKTRVLSAVIAILTGFIITGVTQGVLIPILFHWTNTNISDLATNPWLNIVFFLPCGLLILIFYYIIKQTHFYLIDSK